MSATRMDQFLEQDFMNRDPRIAARLRRIHGLDDPSLSRQLRGRIGMDGAIERPYQAGRLSRGLRAATAALGTGLRRAGEWLEEATAAPCPKEGAL
jgi:hypothetical protein